MRTSKHGDSAEIVSRQLSGQERNIHGRITATGVWGAFNALSKDNMGIKGINLNEKNNQWKGNSVGREALHGWVHRRIKKPSKCQSCH